MPRTSKPRRVGAMPRCCRFGAEAARRDNFHIAMTVEEYETIRLIDYLGKTQEECASLMNVGRGTVQMLYAEARKKLARFLVEGCRLEIGGGDFVLDGAGRGGCPGKGGGCRAADAAEPVRPYEKKGDDLMVIAVTYDNGEVFQHFGHTEQFKLYQVENGRVAASKVVDTAGSGHGEGERCGRADLRWHRRRREKCPGQRRDSAVWRSLRKCGRAGGVLSGRNPGL